MNKQQSRIRRGLKTKLVIRGSNRARLVVHRSATHIYSQIIIRGEKGDKVIASCSTMDKALRGSIKGKNKCDQAFAVGQMLAERAKEHQLTDVAFDRSGYKYHGRVKALATGAREAGLNF